MEEIQKKRMGEIVKKYSPIILFLFAMVLYHILIHEKPETDAFSYFARVLDGMSLKQYLTMRYETWTSRIVIESVLVFFAKSELVWKITDIAMWCILALSTAYLLPGTSKIRNRWIAVGLWLTYSIWEMESAGWIATTINYSWALAMGVFSMTIIAKMFREEKISWWYYGLIIAATIYGANAEQMCAVMLGVYLPALFVIVKSRKSIRNLVMLGMPILITLTELIFILTCPGNESRKYSETISWFPEFADFTVVDKGQMGFVNTMYVLQQNHVALYGILCVLLVFLVWGKCHNFFVRSISIIPAGWLFLYTVFFDKLNGKLQSISTELWLGSYVNKDNWTCKWAYFPILEGIMVVCCILISLYFIFQKSKFSLWPCYLMLLGGATGIVIGFSPTIYASKYRTFIYIDTVMIFLNAILILDNWSYLTDKKWKRCLLFLGSVSAILLSIYRNCSYIKMC